MATSYAGGQSPTTFSKTLERVFEDAQHTGEVILSGRKLKEYPNICSKFDLVDTIVSDLSKNRLTEVPSEICEYTSMERLNCYHNVIRSIPQAIVQLQALTHLNLSRNMLCTIPPFICQLQALEVLIASNNKLVSLPEELGRLDRLMDLDVSCNEISYLPSQIGDLDSLRILNIRRNLLIELPSEICKLKLKRLDFSENKISSIPTVFKNMEMLEDMVLDHNPLTSPPAHVCKKGRVHIMKYLQIEALKEDRKRGVLSDTDMKRLVRKSLPQQPAGSDDFKHISDSPGWKRHTVVGNDSGYNTTDSNEKCNWSPMEVINDFDEVNALALKAGEAVKEQRQHRELEAQRRLTGDPRKHHPVPASPLGNHVSEPPPPPPHQNYSASGRLHPPQSPQNSRLIGQSRGFHGHSQSQLPNSHSPLPHTRSHFHGHPPHHQPASPVPHAPSPNHYAPSPVPDDTVPQNAPVSSPESAAEDAFTRELQRQKADYERRKKVAEQIRMQQQQQDEQERDERRRATLKIQEEQQRVLEQKKEQMRREAEARRQENNNASEKETVVTPTGPGSSPSRAALAATQTNARGTTPAQTPTQPKKKLENKRLPRPARRVTNESSSSFIPIPVVHMNHEENHDTSSPESPSMLPRKTIGSGSAREERRGVGTTSQYRRTSSDVQPGRAGRAANADSHRNGVSEEKVKSAGPSPASSVSSIASNPRSTSSPRHAPTVRKVPIEDRRTASTASPVTRRTKAATSTTNTTTKARSTTSTIASRSRTTGTAGGRMGTTKQVNHMTPEEEFRMRHEAVVGHQRTQTQILRQRLEDEKNKILQAQKEAARETVLNFISKRSVFNGDDGKHTGRNNFTGAGTRNRQVLTSDAIKMLEDYKDGNPNYTIRRQQEHAREEIEQLDMLRNHIESRLKVKLPDNLSDALRDGVVLCHLANQIRPRSVASIHVPSPAVPKLTLAKCRRNVENFLEACRKIGVGNEQICSAHDILEEKGILRLVITVGSLVAISTNPKQSAV
ncbi:LOW QUALITY PROTEIN: uncharacterized protein LOC135479385 [Liolophura sinensis]|uniref:LOW QUALITY PROTEIN: uncharacterized protein LOC135479385 n=1 Tax=Liolophura sinensis TaxID=3198878 RepID=UPI00315865C5